MNTELEVSGSMKGGGGSEQLECGHLLWRADVFSLSHLSYKDYRTDGDYSFTPQFWLILAMRFAFVLLFEVGKRNWIIIIIIVIHFSIHSKTLKSHNTCSEMFRKYQQIILFRKKESNDDKDNMKTCGKT